MRKEENEWREVENFIEKAHKKRLKEMIKKKVLVGVAIAVVAIVVAVCAVVLTKPWIVEEKPVAVYGVDLYFENDPAKNELIKTKEPRVATVTYTITVKNTGNSKETVDLTKAAREGWNIELTKTVISELQPSATETVTLSITPPTELAPGDYTTQITGRVRESTDKTDTITAITRIHKYGVELRCLELAKYITAGKTIVYEIIVNNTGTVSDTINLSITRSSLDWPVSFDLSPEIIFAPGDFTKFAEKQLAPGDFAELKVRVTAPTSATEGAQLKVWVNASSTTEPSKKASIELTTTVKAITGIRVEVEKKNIDNIGYNNDLRISVYDSNNLPVDGASVYIDSKYQGKTGSGDFAPGDFIAYNVFDGWREIKATYQSFVASKVIDVGNTLYISTTVSSGTRGVKGDYSVVVHVYNDTGAV
ncbi:MAG: NEW3 domain-containing protein, partial [Candidatus Thermoplasmatota archaeon]